MEARVSGSRYRTLSTPARFQAQPPPGSGRRQAKDWLRPLLPIAPRLAAGREAALRFAARTPEGRPVRLELARTEAELTISAVGAGGEAAAAATAYGSPLATLRAAS